MQNKYVSRVQRFSMIRWSPCECSCRPLGWAGWRALIRPSHHRTACTSSGHIDWSQSSFEILSCAVHVLPIPPQCPWIWRTDYECFLLHDRTGHPQSPYWSEAIHSGSAVRFCPGLDSRCQTHVWVSECLHHPHDVEPPGWESQPRRRWDWPPLLRMRWWPRIPEPSLDPSSACLGLLRSHFQPLCPEEEPFPVMFTWSRNWRYKGTQYYHLKCGNLFIYSLIVSFFLI